MLNVTFYYLPGDERCLQVENLLLEVNKTIPHKLIKISLLEDEASYNVYAEDAPVILVGPYQLKGSFTEQDIKIALMAAENRARNLSTEKSNGYQERLERGRKLTGADRFSLWFAGKYMLVFNLLVFLYFSVPFLAPVLMNVGWVAPAKFIYTIYSPLCHQLAFRSWFLYGEQTVYPRSLAGIPDLSSYEEVTGENPEINLLEARKFLGNDVMGYKVAICERCVAMYVGIFVFGVLFAVFKRDIKSLPWYLWVLIGLVPIGLDGVSQLPGLAHAILPTWILIRESTPTLRTITGLLFGITTAWYIYPIVEEAMSDTRRLLVRKAAILKQSEESK
jgi:uncharacterized membrane protein